MNVLRRSMPAVGHGMSRQRHTVLRNLNVLRMTVQNNQSMLGACHVPARSFSIYSNVHNLDENGFPHGMTDSTRALAKALLVPSHRNVTPSSESQSNDDVDYPKRLLWKRRLALSQTITLIESSHPTDNDQAAMLLTYLLNQPAKRPDAVFRVGIAGPPGAGKSSLIESLGQYILDLGVSNDEETGNVDTIWKPGKLSVVCIDPSSITTGGSIMGDKTRMMELSRDFRVFVRPSPTKGAWGGLAPRTDDVIRIIAAAETYPLIFLETVGLGQSELEVQQCVDMLVLAVPPGGGDSLQGVKKGIVEIADTIVVTKADGNLLTTAKQTAADYGGAMHFLNVVTEDDEGEFISSEKKTTSILLVSAVSGDGLPKLWQSICDFRRQVIENGQLHTKRKKQDRYWMWRNLRVLIQHQVNTDPALQKLAAQVRKELDAGQIPPRVAASILLDSLSDETKRYGP